MFFPLYLSGNSDRVAIAALSSVGGTDYVVVDCASFFVNRRSKIE